MEGPRLDAHARAGSQRQKRQRACACACAGWVDYERGELDVAHVQNGAARPIAVAGDRPPCGLGLAPSPPLGPALGRSGPYPRGIRMSGHTQSRLCPAVHAAISGTPF